MPLTLGRLQTRHAKIYKARRGLRNSPSRLNKVTQQAKLARKDFEKIREQLVDLVKPAEKPLRHLLMRSNQAQCLRVELESLKSYIDGVVKIRNSATMPAFESSLESETVESRITLKNDKIDLSD